MEFKCTNSNGEIVLQKKLNHVEFFLNVLRLVFINESYKLFFQQDALIA